MLVAFFLSDLSRLVVGDDRRIEVVADRRGCPTSYSPLSAHASVLVDAAIGESDVEGVALVSDGLDVTGLDLVPGQLMGWVTMLAHPSTAISK
jgi:hypothetical protein